jgi:predicted nucleotidyltransferase
MNKKLKNVDSAVLSEAYSNVMQYFFSFPEQSIGLNDLSLAVKSSKTTVKIIVEKLIEEGFLLKEEIGKAWRISVVIRHPFFITRKVPINIRMVYESGIVDAVREKIPGAKAIVLFGSYRWGTDNEKSDIDIAVEISDNHEPKIEELGKINVGYRKNVAINLFIFSRNKVDLNVFNNIANGILLHGFLEVRT